MISIRNILLSCILLIGIKAEAADEFYVNTDGLVSVNGLTPGEPTLFVNGDIINHDGTFINNQSEIELKGDWTNRSENNGYRSTGIERFSGTSDQNIYGDWQGSETNTYYDLLIRKNTIAGQYVSLHANVHVQNRLVFEASAGIVRTQPTSYLYYPGSGDYQFTLSLLNGDLSAIQGSSVSNGAATRFIEGKLKRSVTVAGANYYFPVGVSPVMMDGMEAVTVLFHTLPEANALTAYLREGVTALHNNVIFCDVGTDPTPSYDPFLNCIPGAGQDGIIDIAYLVTASALEWSVTPDKVDAYNYRIEVFPGPKLDATVPILDISECGGPYTSVRYLAKNGIQGGDHAGSVSTGAPVWPAISGLKVCPTGNVLNTQSSFSIFRIHGTENNMTELPVELLNVAATPVDNRYIKVEWTTASERNVHHYEVERSLDAVRFEQIGRIRGPDGGFSNSPRAYSLEDWDVKAPDLYYYRIRNIDDDGSFQYSKIVSARLQDNGQVEIGEIFPNPAYEGKGGIYVNIPEQIHLSIEIFNALGQFLGKQQHDLSPGKTLVPLSAMNYPTGNYVLRITWKDRMVVRKWVIQRK